MVKQDHETPVICVFISGGVQLPLAFLGGTFQSVTSLLGLGAFEILYAPFKNGVSVFYNSLALPNIIPTVFKTQML